MPVTQITRHLKDLSRQSISDFIWKTAGPANGVPPTAQGPSAAGTPPRGMNVRSVAEGRLLCPQVLQAQK